MGMRRNGIIPVTVTGGVLALLVLVRTGFAVDIIDDPAQIDDRAAQVVQTSNSLCWEIHRFHQQQPDYRQTYRTAKEIWTRAGELREALRAGPVETEVLAQQLTQMNDNFTQLEKSLSKWGDGDRSLVPLNGGRRPVTVVNPGVAVDIPFVGVRVGGPRYVVTEEGSPALERRRLHPNSRGSKRSLERELEALKVALSYLLEDAGLTNEQIAPAQGAPAANAPVPSPPEPAGPDLNQPVKIGPKSTVTPNGSSAKK